MGCVALQEISTSLLSFLDTACVTPEEWRQMRRIIQSAPREKLAASVDARDEVCQQHSVRACVRACMCVLIFFGGGAGRGFDLIFVVNARAPDAGRHECIDVCLFLWPRRNGKAVIGQWRRCKRVVARHTGWGTMQTHTDTDRHKRANTNAHPPALIFRMAKQPRHNDCRQRH